MTKNDTMNDILLEVKNLKVYFPVYAGIFQRHVADVKAVDGISFTIKRGETVGLVGESGCGKTTVGRAIINVLRHVSPDVHLEGEINLYDNQGSKTNLLALSNSAMRPFRSRVQMIFQDPFSSLNARMSVKQIVAEPLNIHRPEMSKKEVDDRVIWLLEKVGLQPEYAARFPHEFSGGQRQRIGIARALATNPELIICDEPVSALDVSVQAQVINLMDDLRSEFKMSYLFIAHDLSVVYHISQRIAVMYLGNMMEIASNDQLYFSPEHPYSRALLSAVPEPNPERRTKGRIVLQGDIPTPLNKPSGCAFRTRCPVAQPSCADAVPPMLEIGAGRMVACPFTEKAAIAMKG